MERSDYSGASVEAIVLAGGKGTRLAPLTEDTPKPLLKIMGKSVLETVFDRLNECGVKKAHVTTMYLPWQIEALGTRHGELTVDYVREPSPLGTAGAVKNAYDGAADTVIVLSGDGLYDFDLRAALDFHREKNAEVTIVTYKTENPLEYGVILYDSEGKIQRFAEKPPWAQVVSGTVNTGIYILQKSILERIPSGTEYDFAKQLFPLLLAQKCPLYAYEAKGTWHDIGNLDEYFAANCSALEGKLHGMKNDGLTESELAEKHVDVEMPVYVSRGAVVGENVKLGAFTVIGDHAVVSDGCDIACSVIGDGVTLGMGCGIYGTLIGRNARLGENCVTSEGCAIGGSAEIEDSVILPKFSFIHSGAHIGGSDYLSRRAGKKEGALFGDDGIKCDLQRSEPGYITRIGACAAGVLKAHKTPGSSRVGVMSDGNLQSERFARAALCGVQAAGVRSYDFGYGFEAVARYAAMRFITDVVLYISRGADGEVSVKLFDGAGLPVSSAFEREFSNLFYSAGDYNAPECFYETDRFENLWTLYYSELVKSCRAGLHGGDLSGFVCRFEHDGELPAYSPAYTAICAVSELGGTVLRPDEHTAGYVDDSRKSETISFTIDDAGLEASCTLGGTTLDNYHMGAVLINSTPFAPGGGKLYFSDSLPDAYKELARRKNIEYREYAECSHRADDLSGDDMYRQLWLGDGVYKALHFAVLMKREHATPETLARELPDFAVRSRRFEGNPNRAGVMQRLAKISVQTGGDDGSAGKREGVRLVFANGNITVIPGKITGYRIISEAKSAEAAEELCDKAEEYLR